MTEKRSVWVSLLLSVLPVAVVGLLAALLVVTNSAWYLALNKPAINPPPWVFMVVWSVIYVCDAIALFLLARQNADLGYGPVSVLILTGLLNIAWTGIFFRLHALLPAAAILAALDAALIYLFFAFLPKNKASAYLFLPNIAWGLFALVLNIAFVAQNINF